jgi:hypothetical protein
MNIMRFFYPLLFLLAALTGCDKYAKDCEENWFLVENSLVSNANSGLFCDQVSALQVLEYQVRPPIVTGDETFTMKWEVSEGYEIVHIDEITQLFAHVRMGNEPGEICVTVTSDICGESNKICRPILSVQKEDVIFASEEYPFDNPQGQVTMTINDQAYVGLGYTGVPLTPNFEWFRFDTRNEQYIKLADFPDQSVNPDGASMVIGDKGYVYFALDGNWNQKSKFWEYDPSSDKWTEKTTVFPEWHFAGAPILTYADRGYIIGGAGTGGTSGSFRYETTTDSWTEIPQFPGAARTEATCFSYLTSGYVGPGTTGGSCGSNVITGATDGYALDFNTETWSVWDNPAGVDGKVLSYSDHEFAVFDDWGFRLYNAKSETLGSAYSNNAPCDAIFISGSCKTAHGRDGLNVFSVGEETSLETYLSKVAVSTPVVDWF